MYSPEMLLNFNTKRDIDSLLFGVSSYLKREGLYEYFSDSLSENIECQKKTLGRFNWQAATFIENSPEWLMWTHETAEMMTNRALFVEEIINVLKLWLARDEKIKSNDHYFYNKIGKKTGQALNAHYVVFDYFKIDSPEIEIDVQNQGKFIETLQHERIHTFCRYWKLLKYDIPYSTSIGILTAQIKLITFGYSYDRWDEVFDYFQTHEIIHGARYRNKFQFLDSIRRLKRKYINQIENNESYSDGLGLAIASAVYFNNLFKALMFLELLAFGLNEKASHDIAQNGEQFILAENRFEVFDPDQLRLKMSGWWNPMIKTEMLSCAREHIYKGSFQKIKTVFDDAGISNSSLPHLIGLRGADQVEASSYRFDHPDDPKFNYYSLPHCTYSSKPLVSDRGIDLVTHIKNTYEFMKDYDHFIDFCVKKGMKRADAFKLSSFQIKVPDIDKSEILLGLSKLSRFLENLSQVIFSVNANAKSAPLF